MGKKHALWPPPPPPPSWAAMAKNIREGCRIKDGRRKLSSPAKKVLILLPNKDKNLEDQVLRGEGKWGRSRASFGAGSLSLLWLYLSAVVVVASCDINLSNLRSVASPKEGTFGIRWLSLSLSLSLSPFSIQRNADICITLVPAQIRLKQIPVEP